MRTILASALLLAYLGIGFPPVLPAQARTAESWNEPRVLELVERAREARLTLVTEGGLESYRALTEGHIYFFIDPEDGERALIRLDQVAVELRWQAPDIVQQHLLGERSETRLPVREFRYYLDRLTLVQYGFGDEIQVGSGMDVAGVPHPFAPLAGGDPTRTPYDFRLSDSLTIRLPGEPEPIRMYELEVRPRNPAEPGILGRVLLDLRTAHIVRMQFSFTPASYVDRRTDRIEVELDYGLWEGRYWLPNLQRIEVRRELPELDIGVGTVIRAVLRTRDYELNVSFPDALPFLPPVTQAPEAARRSYAFPEGLFDALERDGLRDTALDVDPREVRARAAELLRNRPPSGLSPFRLHLPRISSGLRYNRGEGLYLGAGGSLTPRGDVRLRVHGGFAFGARTPTAEVRLDGGGDPTMTWSLRAALRDRADLGLTPGSDPILSSLSALVRGEDYLDPFHRNFARGTVQWTRSPGRWMRFEWGMESHTSMERTVEKAPLDAGQAFRPVRPVAEGVFGRMGIALGEPVAWPWNGRGTVSGGAFLVGGRAGNGVALSGATDARWGPASGARDLSLSLRGEGWVGNPLPQAHRLMGGRGTLPGFPYRSFGGTRVVAGSLEGATDLKGALLRLRGGVHGGWAGGLDTEVGQAWEVRETGGVRLGVTLGLGVGWDILRLEGARGLNGGEWQLLLSVDPRWWDRL
jgi:hypothetical protein